MVDFIFTGTREAISNAGLLIQYTLKHLKEMEEMREVVDELQRKIYPRNSPVAYYHNGHVNGTGGGAPRGAAIRSNGSNANQSNTRFRPGGGGGGARGNNSGNGGGNNQRFYNNKPTANSSQQAKNAGISFFY